MATLAPSGIFDNGYIKFGYSGDGTFGYGSNKTPGIFYDTNGTHDYPSNADFLTPGSPFEFFAVKIGGTNYVNNNTNYSSPRMPTTTDTSGVVSADGKTYGTLKFVSTANGLEITQTYTLGVSDQVISISVAVRNTTDATIYGVKYARGIDPDVDSPLGTTRTYNDRGAGDIADSDIILGTGPISDRVIGLYTNSSMAHNTAVSPGWSTDPAALLAGSSENYADSTINLAFDLGDLAAGQTKNFSFAYVFAPDAAALEETVAQVPTSNPPPTLTDFAAPVDSVDEDNTVELSFADLAAQGNEADQNADATEGSVQAFVVKAVSSGTLLIGTSVETATAWAPSSNDVIDSTLNAYWTPAADANGALPAFTVVARDAEGAVSASPVTVTVSVNALNDAPTLASDAELSAIAEDPAVNNGSTVAALFTPRFADADAGDVLAGVIVTGNTADPLTEGTWQYFSEGEWHDIGMVSDTAGLALGATTAIRFAPVPNYNGTPGGLAVHAVDSAYTGGFTSGATPVVFDTTIDAATSGVSTDSHTVSISVSAVNDAPIFTSILAGATRADTSADDAGFDSVSGTLTATDLESTSEQLAFSVRGGSLDTDTGVWTRVGQYGTLSVNTQTGAWTYAPDNVVAINALPEGATAVDHFDFKVADPQGAYSLQALNITFTGTNDEPVLSASIVDQSFNGSGTWSYQVPAATFSDAEGTGLVYSATLADGAPLPTWLSFDSATRTFSGNPPASWDDAGLSIRVTATDDQDESVSDTFDLALSGTANQPPVVSHPLTWQAVDAVNEQTTVAFTGSLGGTTLTFDGATVTLGSAASGADVAAAMAAAFGAAEAPNYDAAVKAGEGNEHVLVLTADATGARGDFTDGAVVNVPGGSYTVDVVTEGVTATQESVQVQFLDRPGDVTSLEFDGVSIDLSATVTAEDVAAAVVAAINGALDATWTAAVHGTLVDTVVLTSKDPGNRVDLDLASFGTTAGEVIVNNGIDGVAEVAELTFGGSYGGAEVTIDGITGSAGSAVSAADVAAALAAHSDSIAGSEFATGGYNPGGAWEKSNFHIDDQNWAEGAVVTLTLPRYSATGTITLTTDPLPANPTGVQIAAALLSAVEKAGTTDTIDDVLALDVNGDGTVGNVGDYAFDTYPAPSDDVFVIWSTASGLDLPNLTPAVFAATTPGTTDHYQVTDNGNGSVTITARTPGDQADLVSGDFAGSYTGAATPAVGTQGAGWSFAIPADTFSDPESDTLTYSAWVIDPVTGDATALVDSPALTFDEVNLKLSGDGLLPDSTLIEIRAEDGSGGVAASQFQLVVYTDTQAASLVAGAMPATVAFANGPGSASYTLPAAAFEHLDTADGDLAYSATLEGGDALPAWLSFDAGTGTFTGNPPAGATDLSVVVTATSASGGGLSASTPAFTLQIVAPNDALVLHAPPPDKSVPAGTEVGVAFTKPFLDPDGTADGTSTDAGITYTATANGDPLSDYGLSLGTNESGQLVISGNAPGGTPALNIEITGTETTTGATATASFTLNLSDPAAEKDELATLSANDAGVVTISGLAREDQTLTAQAPTDADGYSGEVTYQWQVSATGDDDDWIDISGPEGRGQGATLTLAESESGQHVRVQAFYNDDGGTAESPVSTAVEIENVNDDGAVLITGGSAPGQTLSATLSDPDGLAGATLAYEWLRDGEVITGANYSSYTLTAEDGGTHVGVRVTYKDDHGTNEVVTATKAEEIQLGAIAPAAVDDTASAAEAGGLANATPGSDASGILLGNDVDGNVEDTLTITGVRMGAVEGLGRPATDKGDAWELAGDYGTLRVDKATGAYTYTVTQDNDSVQALGAGASLVETFNYTVSDSTLLTDTAKLSITINGANDLATVSGIAATATVAEDQPTALPLELTIADPDGGGEFALRLHVDAGTLRAVSADSGVVISGADTGTLTITAGSPFALQGWLADNEVFYITEPNVHGADIATLTYSLDDGSGSGFTALPGTTSITSSDTNDAAIVDLDGDTPGNNFSTTFRPRGGEVAVVADSVTITDIDPADGLMSAVVTLASGAFDNAFGTVYETLRSTAGSSFEGSLGTIAVTGNGSGENGLTGATQLTFTGAGTQADYQDALKTVVYNNSNPNAFSGDRTVTVTVSDSVMQESDASLFSILAPNPDIHVGQRIFIDGEDSGYTVASKVDDQNYVASGPLATLDAGSTLTFYEAGDLVATATQSGPTIATTTIEVPWTPVIDMSGETLAGRDHAVTYTEGQAGVAIAKPDASITDQDGNIASVVVTLTNPQDGGAESLSIDPTLVTQLATLGITVAGSGTHEITLSGNKDATFFQIGLRGIQYANSADHPDAVTQRVVAVTSTDVDGNTGVGAQTTINLVAVNDAPTGSDTTVSATEDTLQVLNVADFGFVDVDGNDFASLTVVSLPASGTLTLDGVTVVAGQVIAVADISTGKFAYAPMADANGAAAASFQFRVQDNGGTANGGVDLDSSANTLTFDLTPTNDAPVLTAAAPQLRTLTEDQTADIGHPLIDVIGTGKTGISDADTLNNGGAGNAPEAVGRGIAIYALANDGPASGGTWEYYLVETGHGWVPVGSVSEDSALLLSVNDRIRFVPDGDNATTASFSYYLWDGASGTAGDKVDATTRGGTTAFSTGSDTASVEVTAVNDAPVVDLNGDAEGTGFSPIFRPRGDAVAVVGGDMTIADVDRLDADTPDTLVSATVTITGGALDNLFGTTYETLHSTSGHTFAGSMGAIAIRGNGSGENGLTDATQLTFTGAGTHADYEAALKTVMYDNANPNAYSGDRTIEISVRDASVSTGEAGDGLDSAAVTTTVQVPWTPVVDMNGDVAAGRNASVSYTEHSPGVAIAASDASIVDQDGNIKQVVISLTNPLDGGLEKLFVNDALVTQLGLVDITVTGNNSHTITLLGNKDGTTFQLALRAIQYVNESHNADLTPRKVSIHAVDQDDKGGVDASTTINLVAVNDAPQGIDATVTLDEDGAYSFTGAEFGFSDAEGDALQSVVITTLPTSGALTLDGVAVTAGQEIAPADLGKLAFTPLPDVNGPFTLGFQVRDTGGVANSGADLDPTPATLTLDIAPVNDLPTAADGGTPAVSVTGALRAGATLTAVLDLVDVDRDADGVAAATAWQWQSRTVPDGEWVDIADATGASLVLTAGQANREVRVVATYTDVAGPDGSFAYASDRADHPAIVADADGRITLTLDTDKPVLIDEPEGDVLIDTTGTGEVTIRHPAPDTTVTTTGTGPVTIEEPQGDLTLDNGGTGTVRVSGVDDDATLHLPGTGDVTVADPHGDLTVDNTGTGTATVTGLPDDGSVTTTGTGPVTITDPQGDLAVDNQGSGPVRVEGVDDGATLHTSGPGSTTVRDPDGDLALTSDGPGYVTVQGAKDGATITTSGAGDVHVDQPAGELELVNNQDGDGDLFVDRPVDGAALHVSGTGPTTVTNPAGDLTLDNDGPGLVTAKCLADGRTVTTSGEGDVLITRPRGSVDLVNHQSGSGTVTVDGVHNGESVHVAGEGPTLVSNPAGDLTVHNDGPGLVTTAGMSPDHTLTVLGEGPQALDLAGFPDDGHVALDNRDGAPVDVLHAPDGATVQALGGDLTVTAPTGDITIDNDGTGTVHVEQVADGITVTKTGSGPAVIDHPAGDLTLANDDTGLVTVRHLGAGDTLTVAGTGPVAIESALPAGEHVTVDATGNGNVRLSNDGAGTIDVLGDLLLDSGDPMHIRLNGDGTTALTVAGAVSLDGTPLELQLDADWAPHLGNTVTLLDNDGSDAVTGHFAGLPEGQTLHVGGQLFRISYSGGTGNDVVLTRVNDGPTGGIAIAGTVAQGETLSVVDTLADSDGLGTVRYQWLADGALLAVGSSYVVTQDAVGKAIQVVASYTDAQGTAESVASAATEPVANVNDAPTGAVLVSGTASLGQTLAVSNTLDDADGMGTVAYQWQADGVDIAGATGTTLHLGAADIGKAISVSARYVDGLGTAEQVHSAATAPVADGNGVEPSVEAQVPTLGQPGSTGDGNGDGIADALQPGVASAALARSGGHGPSFVTLVVDSVDGKPQADSAARLVDFAPVDTPADVPSWAQLPTEGIGFTALADAPGAVENFSLYVDADLGVNGYWAHNADGVLVNLASEAYGGRMVVEGDKIRLDFQITEGGEFDAGPAGDTTIVSHGAAGHASLSLVGYTIDIPDGVDAPSLWD